MPGLRRSEVAALADMSVEYYAELERGNLAGVSPSVLEALARALQLDDAERAHLLNPAQAADITVAILLPPPQDALTRTPLQQLTSPYGGPLTNVYAGRTPARSHPSPSEAAAYSAQQKEFRDVV